MQGSEPRAALTWLRAMEKAKRADSFLYPLSQGTTEASLHGGPCASGQGPDDKGDGKGPGKGKGKGKPAWQFIRFCVL